MSVDRLVRRIDAASARLVDLRGRFRQLDPEDRDGVAATSHASTCCWTRSTRPRARPMLGRPSSARSRRPLRSNDGDIARSARPGPRRGPADDTDGAHPTGESCRGRPARRSSGLADRQAAGRLHRGATGNVLCPALAASGCGRRPSRVRGSASAPEGRTAHGALDRLGRSRSGRRSDRPAVGHSGA